MQITIRPYEDRYEEEIAGLWFESWRSTGLAVAQQANEAAMRARFAQELTSGWSVYVAWDGGCLVGFLALKLDVGCLDQIFVSPSAQGLGVGLALLDFAKQRMPEGIWLRTARDNVRACRFYERSGFKSGETNTHPTLGHSTITYRWP